MPSKLKTRFPGGSNELGTKSVPEMISSCRWSLRSDTLEALTRYSRGVESQKSLAGTNSDPDDGYSYRCVEYPNGSRFLGWFDSSGKRSGHGRILKGANAFQGNWEEDLPHDNGTLCLENGFVYEGQWLFGLPHGRGVVKLTNGSTYVGKWKDGQCEGRGKFVSNRGQVYSGEFHGGLPNGQGLLINSKGVACSSTLVDGVPVGVGEISWPTGQRYLGGIVDGKPHGLGIMLDSTRVTLGLYKGGNLGTRLEAHEPLPEALHKDPAVDFIQQRLAGLANSIERAGSLHEQ